MDNLNRQAERILCEYGDILFRTCLLILGSSEDAQDAVQDTMIKYIKKSPEFKDKKHEKAWLIKVAGNRCRDILRYRLNHPQLDIDSLEQYAADTKDDTGILEALMQIPEKYRYILILYYVEGYKTDEIADIVRKSISAVKMRLKKGRELLEDKYRKEYML